MRPFVGCFTKAKPYIAVICLQLGSAGMTIIVKFALDHGLSPYSYVVYRHVIATIVMAPFALILDRGVRPKMTRGVFVKILLLGLLEPVIDQDVYYLSMKYASATFSNALSNVLPALTFIMAWICRLEKVNLKKIPSQAKVAGTAVTVVGAMLMTFVKGPLIKLPWTGGAHIVNEASPSAAPSPHGQIKGAIMVFASCTSWACFMILQAKTIQSYPAELSLTALICAAGSIEGLTVALAVERSNTSIWALHFDSKLLAYVYSGVICSGITYYIQGVIMKTRGPVFITASSPLSTVIVAVLGSFILSEKLFLGSVIGAIAIIAGLYLVVWGKSKDQTISSGSNNTLPESLQTTADLQRHGNQVTS